MKIDKTNFLPIAKSFGYIVEAEYNFIPSRRFRADWFILIGNTRVLIEYEGIAAAKSRHTSIVGYTKDCEKYNLAAMNGFIVLRYTALNFDNVFKDLKIIKNNNKKP